MDNGVMGGRTAFSAVLASFLGACCVVGIAGGAAAQSSASVDPYGDRLIERVIVRIANPSGDSALDARVQDQVRTLLGLFPGDRFSEERIAFQLAQARRIKDVAATDYDVGFGERNGLQVTVNVTLGEGAGEARGLSFGGSFPTLYDRNGTFIRAKLELLSLYYANDNAWYARPDAMLAGNPLVQGQPSGSGWDQWIESYAHYGIYGITPLNSQTYVYGGLSAISALSTGQELFTDRTRTETAIEDAYVGIVGGMTDGRGNRLAYNLSVGRQRFTLADGFLIANTAGNGHDRAALQANARWASDFLGLAQLSYNDTKVELFYLDPDELPVIDSETTYAGINVETKPVEGLKLGFSYVTAPKSNFSYFSPLGGIVGTREGLQVFDARFNYEPASAGQSGPFFGGEYAVQRNRNFDMDARAGWLEAGYRWPEAAWSPSVSYRLSMFSGDDPATSTYERWDPMLSGGNGQQWVQGANHFKVVQDSNVIAHRIQAVLRPSPKVEIVPQLWAFYADQKNNIGGNPALSFLGGKEYGFETNVTAKWFVSRNTYVHGHLAYTIPGDATKAALGGDAKNWLSAMVFVRYAF